MLYQHNSKFVVLPNVSNVLISLDTMSEKEDDKSKGENQQAADPTQDSGATAEDEEEKGKSKDEDTAGCQKVENKADYLHVAGESQVYTATKDTLFSKNTSVAETQALVRMFFVLV